METKKVLTYVDGLDEALGGGLPAGHVVLVSGLPGTMKSTLSYSILHRNATERGARGLYVSLEQTRKSLEDEMSAMGLDVESVRGEDGTRARTGGRCHKMRLPLDTGESCRGFLTWA